MASTYSPNLRLELIGTGEQQGTWGATTNTNLGTLIEEAIGGYVSVTVTDGADTTLTTANGSADQSRNMTINLTGTLSAARNVICPAIEKIYIVKNATSGGFAVTFKVSGQTGVSIPNGATFFLYVDGTDVRQVTGSLASQNSTNVSITGGTIVASASSLGVLDADGSNKLSFAAGSNLTANTTLTLTTGASTDRTLDISASNVTISTAGANLIDDASASDQRTTLGLGTIATQNSNNVTITGGSISGITDLALADGGTGASLSDPGANAVLGWNDTSNTMRFFTAGTGISIDASTNTIASTVTSGGGYAMQVFSNTTPGGTTWTKPAGLKAVRVTVVGGGGGSQSVTGVPPGTAFGGSGGGGASIEYIPAPSIPGPVTVTVGAGGGVPAPTATGGTSSFGTFVSATGGATSPTGAGAAGGSGSGGQVNVSGEAGDTSERGSSASGRGGASGLGFGAGAPKAGAGLSLSVAGAQYGGGASGSAGPSTPGNYNLTGAAGAQGIVIVEEFY